VRAQDAEHGGEPSPRPMNFVMKNGLNMREHASSFMPIPSAPPS
jgi:hypothetical protein